MNKKVEFKGCYKGVRLIQKGINDNHILVEILTEDDDYWFASNNPFDSYWISDLIKQLQIARKYLKTQQSNEGFGWKFKSLK